MILVCSNCSSIKGEKDRWWIDAIFSGFHIHGMSYCHESCILSWTGCCGSGCTSLEAEIPWCDEVLVIMSCPFHIMLPNFRFTHGFHIVSQHVTICCNNGVSVYIYIYTYNSLHSPFFLEFAYVCLWDPNKTLPLCSSFKVVNLYIHPWPAWYWCLRLRICRLWGSFGHGSGKSRITFSPTGHRKGVNGSNVLSQSIFLPVFILFLQEASVCTL